MAEFKRHMLRNATVLVAQHPIFIRRNSLIHYNPVYSLVYYASNNFTSLFCP